MPIPFIPYDTNSTIAEMILRAGQQNAEATRQQWGTLANTVGSLGQIPEQIAQRKQLEAKTALETARAARETELYQSQQAALARQAQQRGIASKALVGDGGQSVLDPDALMQRLQGADPDTIKETLGLAASLREQKQTARQAQKDMLGGHGLALLSLADKPHEQEGVQTLLQSLNEEETQGLVPKGTTQQLATQYQQDPASLRQVAFAAIQQSPSALKSWQETYGKQTKVGADEKVYQGLGMPGEGAAPILEGGPKPITPYEQERLAIEKQNAANAALSHGDAVAARGDARLDRSYQFNSAQLEKVRQPLVDQSARIDRLMTTINERTPQADALLAPELLTVMAGGAGSGLRMNEAEISRIVGGRSKLEDLKAALNKWQLDPTKALSVTEEQRAEMQKLVSTVRGTLSARVEKVNKAAEDLANANDVEQHRHILSSLKSDLTAPAIPDTSAGQKVGRFTVEEVK